MERNQKKADKDYKQAAACFYRVPCRCGGRHLQGSQAAKSEAVRCKKAPFPSQRKIWSTTGNGREGEKICRLGF